MKKILPVLAGILQAFVALGTADVSLAVLLLNSTLWHDRMLEKE